MVVHSSSSAQGVDQIQLRVMPHSSQVHRERIKDSCDQLRVLLPYVRGRKTDMTSILEMTVDYLKIVNSNLPHEFHAHVGVRPPASHPPRTPHVMCSGGRGPGRGGRGGRASGRRSTTPTTPSTLSSSSSSPPPSATTRTLAGLQDCSFQNRLVTRAVSRGVMSSPVPLISRAGGNGGSRGSKLPRRSLQQSVMMSPVSQGMPSLYLLEGKERAVVPVNEM
ncbi:hypothetical protein ACOMHN_030309 [Nucella lapillus]